MSATELIKVHGIIPENTYGINSLDGTLNTREYTVPITSTNPNGDKKDQAIPKIEFRYLFLKSCFAIFIIICLQL